MKTSKTMLIILICYLGFLNNALGQILTEDKNQSPQELYDFHISKKKANKTAAWIALGGGIAMIVVGLAINSDQPSFGSNSSSDDNNKGLWLSYLGGAATLVSIPLFIACGEHNKKAKIQLQNGAVGFDNKINYSGISITFSF